MWAGEQKSDRACWLQLLVVLREVLLLEVLVLVGPMLLLLVLLLLVLVLRLVHCCCCWTCCCSSCICCSVCACQSFAWSRKDSAACRCAHVIIDSCEPHVVRHAHHVVQTCGLNRCAKITCVVESCV